MVPVIYAFNERPFNLVMYSIYDTRLQYLCCWTQSRIALPNLYNIVAISIIILTLNYFIFSIKTNIIDVGR